MKLLRKKKIMKIFYFTRVVWEKIIVLPDIGKFLKIFDHDSDQKKIFETVAKPVVSSVLQGFNGTVFAYGQTGSGKTFTMTGSPKKYQERGIIPRSLQYIFSNIDTTEEKPTIYISYMEIYNEICYDLLNPKECKTASRLEELPRVAVLEDKKGEPHLRNLSVLPVTNEEEAMRLLFLGDTNRAIAETPLNEYSSRSHCIFTIYMSFRPRDSNKSLRYSKLNLVDLAGSERVHKSHITGTTLTEAKHINLSLHFLQQVILALSESNRPHIPYRNSLMTFILKDSLSGNCLTVMLATLAVSSKNIQETISTCKFAQRVSLISTEPVINEVSDPHQEILLLRNEIQELRKQLANKSSLDTEFSRKSKEVLTENDKLFCEKLVNEYLGSPNDGFNFGLDVKQFEYCLLLMKRKIATGNNNNDSVKKNAETSTQCKSVSPKSTNNVEERRRHIKEDPLEVKPSDQHDYLLEIYMTNPQNLEEKNHYTKLLTCTYEKAKIFATTIEECQRNIKYIREKLDVLSNREASCKQKFLLGTELKHQQSIYRKSIVELKELKNETLQLEAGLKKAEGRMKQRFSEWKRNRSSQNTVRSDEIFGNDYGECHSDYVDVYADHANKFRHIDGKGDVKEKFYCKNCFDEHETHLPPIEDRRGSFQMNANMRGFPESDYKQRQHRIFCNGRYENDNELYTNCYSNYDRKNIKIREDSNCRCLNERAMVCKTCNCNDFHQDYAYIQSIGNVSGCQENSYYLNSYRPTCEGYNFYGTYINLNNKIHCSQEYHRHMNVNQEIIQDTDHDDSCVKRCDPICLHDIAKGCKEEVFQGKCFLKRGSLDVTEKRNENQALKNFFNVPDKLEKDGTILASGHSHKEVVEVKKCCTNDDLDSKKFKFIDSKSDDNITALPINDNKEIECSTVTINENEVGNKVTYNIFLDADKKEFRNFMKNIQLTGDEETDKEICNFYRSKLYS